MDRQFLNHTILILCTAISIICAAEDLIDRPENMDKPSKEEKGILATIVLVYSKAREAVKYAYDEIMYWREIKTSYNTMKQWFDKTKRNAKSLFNESTKLFTDPKDVFTTLDRLEYIFDGVEYMWWSVPEELDKHLLNLENDFDALQLAPNTDEVISFIETTFELDQFKNPDTKQNRTLAYIKKQEIPSQTLYDNYYRFQETATIEALKLVTSSAIAKSEMYKHWTEKAWAKIAETEKEFADVKGVNGLSMAGCWYAVEAGNVNNKVLYHNLEDTKMLQAMLSLYLFDMTKQRTAELAVVNEWKGMEKELVNY